MKKNNQKNIKLDWKYAKITDFVKIYDGTHQTPNYVERGIPFYSVEHVTSDNFINTKFISEEVYNKEIERVKIEKGDILMTRIGDIGTAKYVDWNVKASFYVTLALIKSHNENLNMKFLEKIINSTNFQIELWKKTIHVAFPNKINLGDISKCYILLPPLTEQNKIVQILEAWDKYLEKLNKKIEIKKQIKKGLSNSFLYKRKDVEYFSISDLFILGRGRVISKNEIKSNLGEFPVYSSQTSNNGILGKINTYDFQGNYITWTTDGANAGRVYFRSGKFNCTNVCGVAKLKEGKEANLYYIVSYLNYITHKYVSYVGNPKLMNNVFGAITIALPDIEKQNYITEILSSADREIESLEKKKKIVEAQKKFLLNNLISGKIRHPEFINS